MQRKARMEWWLSRQCLEHSSLDLTELAGALGAKRLSAREALTESLSRAEKAKGLNAFISLLPDRSKAEADKSQASLEGGDAGVLCGVPIAHKDIYMTTGTVTSCASKILEKYVAPYESFATKKLEDSGMVTMGKCNMDEFAMGTTGENSAFGATANPWNSEHSPGGSSSGSAAAVAARIALAATGTDTGGSVRMPAAYCGICGIKPTYGLISRRGIVAYASSLDQAGVLATSARDLRAVLSSIAGHDSADSTSLADASVPAASQENMLEGKRIGIAKEFFEGATDAKVAARVVDSIEALSTLGAKVSEISIPHLEHSISAYYIIACAEASSNLARYDGLLYGTRAEAANLSLTVERSRSQGFGAEVQRRIMLGAFVLSHGYVDAYYRQAQRIRRMLALDFAAAFSDVDLIATPGAPTTAPKLGAFADDPVLMYSQDICTAPVNLAGLPAIAIPCGTIDGLPVGLQLIGPDRSEDLLLAAAEQYQLETDHHQALPPGVAGWDVP